jgi:glucose-6-phosphate-specific signal transduction histidine kinase
MPEGLSSLIITLVLTLLLAVQARRAAARTRLRQAFVLSAAATAVAATMNLLVLLGRFDGWVATALMTLTMAFFLAGVLMLSLAFLNGELRTKLRQAQDLAAAERTRQAAERSEENDEHRA